MYIHLGLSRELKIYAVTLIGSGAQCLADFPGLLIPFIASFDPSHRRRCPALLILYTLTQKYIHTHTHTTLVSNLLV